jgi:RNA polymerase sigma factor (sigma-70 family)
MNDWELLEQFRSERSQPAFAELVRRHAGFVYATCRRRLRDVSAAEQLAEDVAQAVFLLLARRPPQRAGSAALAGWLHQTAVYACKNAMRAEQIRQHHEHQAAARRSEVIATSSAPLQLDVCLERAMDALSPRDRDALLLRYYQGLDVGEIALALGIPSNSATKRISRAIDRLRRALVAAGAPAASATVAPALVRMTHELAPPHLPASIASTAFAGAQAAAPSLISEQIAQGVNHMIRLAQIQLTAAITIVSAFAIGAVIAAGTLLAQTGSPPSSRPAAPAAAASRGPATAPTALTPKQVLHEFAAAVRAGDGEKIAALGKANNEQDRQLIQAATAYVTATGTFKKAVADKLGPEAARETSSLFELTPVGRFALLIETTADKSPEVIEGNVAMIQPPEIQDLTFWLVKENGRWLMSIERMTERWTADEWRDRLGLMHMAAGALNDFAERVSSGQYETLAELKRDLAPIVRQNR